MTLDELLDTDPSAIAKLSHAELVTLLTPYFPVVRKAMLPPEKSKKKGLDNQLIKELVALNQDRIKEILSKKKNL